MGDDIVELSVENESLKNQIGQFDKKLLQESKAKLLKKLMMKKESIYLCLERKNRWKDIK